MANAIVATVTSISVRAQARNAEGELRELKVGDKLLEGETLVTPNGGRVELSLSDGSPLVVSDVPEMAVTRDLVAETAAGADESAVEDETVQQVLTALQSGEDLGDVLSAPAAGPTAVSGLQGEGHSFIRLSRILETTDEFTGVAGSAAAENLVVDDDPALIIPAVDPGAVFVGLGSVGVVLEERYLPDGSTPDGANLSKPGSFTVLAEDGLKSLTVDGVELIDANGNFISGQSVMQGPNLLITFDSMTVDSNGEYTIFVTGTLNGDFDHNIAEGNNQQLLINFDIVLVDAGGQTASGSRSATIIDDGPAAAADSGSVTEDGVSSIGGNVLTNDSSGADESAVFTSWAAGNAANTAALNIYGTLTLNGDGTWTYELDNSRAATQALTAQSNLSYALNYTMQDADGDTSLATLTITITGAADGSSVETAQATGPDATVLEHGLTSVPDATETVTGSFKVTTTDGILNVVIGGTAFTYAQLTNAAYLAAHPVSTGEGVLTLTGYTGTAFGGTVNYSYTLSATIDNDSKVPAGNDTVDATGFNDSVVLTVNGIGGTSGSDNLVIRAVDDTPTVVNDGPATVTEDGAGAANTATTSTVNGSVLTNDSAGADVPQGFTSWDNATAAHTALDQYGTLTLNPDGTYSFVLNNALAAVQALTATSTITQVINYTMQDADGDTKAATLTLVIKGANDGSSVETAQATGPDATVLEHGLTSVPDATETVTGSFKVTTTDGILNVVIGGTAFTYAQLTNAAYLAAHPVSTGEGVLTLTGYTGTAFGGTVNYSYTLSATIDNDSKVPAGNDTVDATGFNDSVVLTVNGIGGTSGSDNLVIRAVDDTPTVVNDGPATVTEDGAGAANTATTSTVNGSVLTNDSAGADVPQGFTSWDNATAAHTALDQYGTLTLNPDGTYSFVLNNALAAVQALTATSTITQVINYTMQDADGDTKAATLTLVIKGANDGSSVETAQATGPDATVLEHGLTSVPDATETVTGSFKVTTTDGILNVVIGGTAFTYAQLTNAAYLAAHPVSTGEGVLTLTGYTGTAFGGTVNYSYTLSATIDNDSKVPAGNDTVDATGFNDSVVLTVNGIGGTSGSDNLVIRAVDDTPTVVNDGPATVTEDGAGAANTATTSTVNGSVLTNDSAGADVPQGFTSWDNATAAHTALDQYGTLTLNPDGTYSFVLNNALAAVQALTATSTITQVINYTMQDADGDTKAATLTLVIKGANDGSSVETAQATGPDATVLEHGLTSVPDATETVTGSFKVTTTDGILNVVIGGTAFTYAQLTNAAYLAAHPVSTGEGVLTLTGYTGTAFGGTVNYSYTLSATIDNDSKVPAGNDTVDATGFNDSVVLTVNGIGGTSGSDNLVIRAVDDTPTVVNDGPATVTEDGAGAANTATTSTVNGSVLTNDSAGADVPQGFTSWDNATAAHTALDQYGTLTLNPDGTYSFVLNNALAAVQALTATSTITQVINYTMQDADGDTKAATLTLVIKGANDGSSVETAQATGPDATVLEHGLTSVPDATETVTGSFKVTTTDGILNVVIGGTAFTYAQLTNAAYLAAHPVSTGEGVLTLTGYTGTAFGGTVNYSYTLSATIDNDSKVPAGNDTVDATGFNDSVVLTVNGIGGTSGSDNLVIRAVDDTPTVVNDGPATVTEDGAGAANTATTSTVNGSVLTNDSAGADVPQGFTSWDNATAAHTALDQYGTLTLNPDGTYSFVLNNALAAVQALTATSTITQVINYTMQDADGDTKAATLTLVIKGANDGSSVETAQATGPDATVLEHGLTSVPDATETVTGSFKVTTTDGILNVVIGGTAFTYAQLTNAAYLAAHPVSTGEGVLTLTGYTGTAFGGTVNYSYTLSATIDNDSKVPAGNDTVDATGFNDSVVLTVNGIGGTSGSDNLVIRAVDDTPTVVNDGPATVTEDGAGAANTATTSTVNGSVLTNDSAGADVPQGFTSWDNATAAHTALDQYGTLTLNPDGTYSFVLNNALAAVQALTATSTITQVINYTMQDADGDTKAATLTLVIKGANDGSSVETAQATGPDATVLEHGLTSVPDATETVTGSFKVTTTDGILNVVIGGTAFTYAQLTNAAYLAAHPVSTGEGVLTLTGYTGTAFGGTVNYSYTLSATIDNDSKVPAGNDTVDATGFNDSVVLTVNGIGGTSGSDNLVIRAVDDTPTAYANINSVTEGGVVGGNVLTDGTDDVFGADGAVAGGGVVGVKAGSNTSTPVTTGLGGAGIVGTYGTLTLNADGSYSYEGLPNVVLPAGATDTFVYTIKDGDGDMSTTTLTITLTDSGLVATSDDETRVFESDLDLVKDGADLVAGTVTGSVGTGGALETDASNTLVGNVTGGVGALTYSLVGSATGLYGTIQINSDGTYVYTLTKPYDTTPESNTVNFEQNVDQFTYEVKDANGNTQTATIFVDIVDDFPKANPNTNSVIEGGVVGGNVLTDGTDDVFGADGAVAGGGVVGVKAGSNTSTPVTTGLGGAGIVGTYGTLTLNANGSYSYDGLPNVVPPAGATDTFVYTIKDGDGDMSTTTLTITLTDSGLAATNDDIVVNEAALATGRNPSSPAETAAGTLAGNVTGGTPGYNYTLVGSGDGAYGTLTLNPNGTYSYTLDTRYDTSPDANNGTNTENNRDTFTYQATDATGNTVTNTITIDIIDDVPTVGNFVDFTVSNAIGVTDGPTNSGFISGADNWSSINIIGEVIAGLTYKPLVTNPDGSVTLTAKETVGGADVFSYTVFKDGSQSFNLIKPEAETLITQNLSNLSPGGPTPFLELPDFSIEFFGSGSGVNSSTQGMGIGNQFLGAGEVLALEFYKPGRAGNDVPDNISGPANAAERLISSLDFTNSSNGGGTLNWKVYNTIDGTTDSGSVNEVNGHYLIDAAIDFNKIEITGGANANVRLTSVVIGERLLPDGEDITFTVTGTDGDGDVTSSDNITVTIDPAVAPIAPIQQFSAQVGDIAPGTSLQNATSEPDTLIATDDADVFVWSLADNSVQGDTIVGFNAQTDAINIADLLADTVDTTDFSSYLNVSVDGASTVLRISSTGDFEHADQVITVQDVNLFEGVDFSDTAAISTALQNIVDAGKLITD